MDDLTKDFQDVLLAQKNTKRMQDPKYYKLWHEKSEDVKKRIAKLSEEEYNQLESDYKKWIDENSNSFRSTH
jgi:hypothetical protein